MIKHAKNAGEDLTKIFFCIEFVKTTYKGKYFLQKVDIIEETEYDEIIQCDHSYDSR